MDVHLTPEIEAKLEDLAAFTGRAKDELALDIVSSYLDELTEVRAMLDRRYEQVKSGRVGTVDGEEAFARIREKSDIRRDSRA
jgi:predicted transcriptional regulator